MRIAFDHRIFTAQVHGGVSRVHARLARELAAQGETVRIVAPLHANAYLAGSPLVEGRAIAPSRAGRLAMRLAARLLAPSRLAGFRPDVIIETWYDPPAPASRTPRITIVHDMIHELFPQHFPAGDPTAAWKAAAIAAADHIVCISENTRADLLALHPGAASKSSVIPLGCDPWPDGPALVHPRPYLLFVGHRGGYKNFAGLVAALAHAGAAVDCDVLAIGGGALTPAERQQISAAGLDGRIHQRGADDAGLAAAYRGAAALVYPSLYEGFGLPPLEAMAAGTPVIAIRASSIPEVCGDAALYADPGDTTGLAAAITTVLGDPARRAALVTAGQARVAMFGWARAAAAWKTLCAGLVTNGF